MVTMTRTETCPSFLDELSAEEIGDLIGHQESVLPEPDDTDSKDAPFPRILWTASRTVPVIFG